MTDRIKYLFFSGALLLFIAINSFFIVKEKSFFHFTPLVIFILLFALYKFDYFLFFCVLLTPFSITIRDSAIGIGMALPVEPLLVGALLLFIIKIVTSRYFDGQIYNHPISIAIIFYLLWMLITSITSSFPVVSFKFWLSKLWYIFPIFFLGIPLFKNLKNIYLFLWIFLIPLCIVLVYVTFLHYGHGFDEEIGHWIMSPFFNDHTAYGAIIAFMIPVTIGLVYSKKNNRMLKIVAFICLLILIIATYFSFCRAAWLSLAITLGIYVIIKFKINLKLVFLTIIIVATYFFLFQFEIMNKLERNTQDSSDDFYKHISSITNISTDASNLERLNRWNCALRMFEEKPLLGWGPGTYQFNYAPFQKADERTIISTNSGDGGNAHSEYLGPLAESGILGPITFILIIIIFFVRVNRIIQKSANPEIRNLTLSISLGFTTYIIHGILNNFLDTEKASVLFWGFLAIIAAIDIYHVKTRE